MRKNSCPGAAPQQKKQPEPAQLSQVRALYGPDLRSKKRIAEDSEILGWALSRAIPVDEEGWQRQLLLELGRELSGQRQRLIWTDSRHSNLVSRVALQMSDVVGKRQPNIAAACDFIFTETKWAKGVNNKGMLPQKAMQRFYAGLRRPAVRRRLNKLCKDLRAGRLRFTGMTQAQNDSWASEIEGILNGRRDRRRRPGPRG